MKITILRENLLKEASFEDAIKELDMPRFKKDLNIRENKNNKKFKIKILN